MEWEYEDRTHTKFHSCICSGAQRLPNGNTFICEATKGRLFEVTPDKEIVWEFFNPFYLDNAPIGDNNGLSNIVFRALRYSPDYEGLKGRGLDPDKFEWGLQEREEAEEVYSPEERVIAERLKRLGY